MKRKQGLKVILFLAISVLAGCAGNDFTRPDPEVINPGSSRYSQVLQKMGEPIEDASFQKNGKTMRRIRYVWANTEGTPLEQGVIPARSLYFYFYNDSLVGETFVSSFKADNTDFDETKASSVVRGKTTRTEIIRMWGRPSVVFVPPMAKEGGSEEIGYLYATTRMVRQGLGKKARTFNKTLMFLLDDKGVVTDVLNKTSSN